MADGRIRMVINQFRRLIGRQTGSTLTDAQLLENYTSRRDEASFELLVWRHASLVLSLCQRVLRDSHAAEDAFQATFLVFARKAGSIGKREAVASWLYKVAYRVALRVRARTAQRNERELVDELPGSENADDVVWRDLRPVLDREIDRLPPKYRAPFVLCYLQGYTNEEAAAQLHCPKGTILSRLARGRERLRARLASRGLALSVGLLTSAFLQTASADASAALVDSTVQAAIPYAAGKATTGLVSAAVVALSEGVIRTMYWTKLKIAVAVAALILLGTGASSMARSALADRAPAGERPAADGERDKPAGRDGGNARAGDKAAEVVGKVVSVGKDGKSFVVEVRSGERRERGEPEAEPKKVDVKIGEKTTVVYDNVGANAARPTEGYTAQVRMDGDAAASVTFRGLADNRSPSLSGKVTAVAGDGKGITVEVSPARGRGDDVQEAKTVDLKFTDKTVVLYSAVAKDGAKLTVDYRASVWLEDGPKGTTAASVHLVGDHSILEERGGPASDVSGKVVAVAKDGGSVTVDSIVCLYSLHHMTGQTRAENVALVRRAFEEFARTLKPGGHLFVTEVLPWAVASGLQFLVWDVARRWLGPTLDQYFWQRASLVQLAAEILGPCRLETFTARTAPGLLVPPVFSLPWLKIPRALYPFEGTLFHWQRASS